MNYTEDEMIYFAIDFAIKRIEAMDTDLPKTTAREFLKEWTKKKKS